MPERPLLALEMSRALVQGAVAFLITVLWGGWLVRFLRRRGVGKKIREEGPERHRQKAGTPTMGGIMIVVTVTVVTLLLNLRGHYSMLLPVGVMVGCALLGAVDDLVNLASKRGEGLGPRVKFAWLFAIALAAAYMLWSPHYLGPSHTYFPFMGAFDLQPWIGRPYIYIPLATLVILGTANTVNLADGLDGLAGSTAGLAFAAYGLIAYLQRQDYLFPFCFTIVGSLLAFLWYNAYPAQVFMGDTGSLALGAALAVVALMTWQWIILPVIGVVFVAEGVSDILQVGYFKWTKRRYGQGRRIFKMSPLHHHFELIGWSETQIVARFAIVGVAAAMVGVALALV
jgi:phospho-N-acetylmuramoyl-pentapeptide-transferase